MFMFLKRLSDDIIEEMEYDIMLPKVIFIPTSKMNNYCRLKDRNLQ